MEYEPYQSYELHDMLVEPRRIAKYPYKLHAAYMLDSLFDLYENDEDEPLTQDSIWGWMVDKDDLDKLVENANADFIDACDNDLPIDIKGKSFTIRHSKDLNKDRLKDIFKFPIWEDGRLKVVPNGVMNLEKEIVSTKNEFEQNKAYLERVIQVAEDDEHDGWNKLTDMEVTMYMWQLWCHKHDERDYSAFRQKCERDLYTKESDDRSCFNDKATATGTTPTQFLFSAKKVIAWNKAHSQLSVI